MPSALKLWSTSRTRSSLVKVTRAIGGASIAWAERSTICARRQVTTEPELRRMIRSSRLPSSFEISRIRTRSAMRPPRDDDRSRGGSVYITPILAGNGRRLAVAALGGIGSRFRRPAVLGSLGYEGDRLAGTGAADGDAAVGAGTEATVGAGRAGAAHGAGRLRAGAVSLPPLHHLPRLAAGDAGRPHPPGVDRVGVAALRRGADRRRRVVRRRRRLRLRPRRSPARRRPPVRGRSAASGQQRGGEGDDREWGGEPHRFAAKPTPPPSPSPTRPAAGARRRGSPARGRPPRARPPPSAGRRCGRGRASRARPAPSANGSRPARPGRRSARTPAPPSPPARPWRGAH